MPHPDKTEESHPVLYVQYEYGRLKDNPGFSDASRLALQFAEDETLAAHQLTVGPDNLLTGLLRIPRVQSDKFARFADRYFIGNQTRQVDEARRLIDVWRENTFRAPSLQLSFSDSAAEILRIALDAADDERRKAAPIHIMTGMISVGGGMGSGLLYELIALEHLELSKKTSNNGLCCHS